MYKELKKYLLVSMMVFLVGCSDTSKDESSSNKESLITTTQAYKTAYYTNFVHQNGNNLFEESNGTLHLAFVDNYELYYSKSADNGKTWSKEKIETGHDGALRRASLSVDANGKVFIGFTTHDKYNYANLTSVAYGTNFEFDTYCATNKTGEWSVELLYAHENGTTGREIASIDVDADNNIHIFANFYGWWSYGGTAYEYVRSATTDTWDSGTQIAQFSDTNVDKFIYGYYRSHIQSNGDITIVSMRNGSTPATDKLFYIKKQSGIWQDAVELDTPVRANPRVNHFDSAIDSSNHIYLAYVKDDNNGDPQVLFSKDFGATSAIYTATLGEVINGIKLHSDESGNLTLVVNNDTNKSVIATKSSTGSWTQATDLDTSTTNAIIYNLASVETNTASGDFTTFKMSYLENKPVALEEDSYDSNALYFYSH
jgi:hypothetical protein